MEVKSIKLSPKKGGNGFVSSYTVNIGSTEAQKCNLLLDGKSPLLVKVVNPENNEISIHPKKINFLKAEIDNTIRLACELSRANLILSNSIPEVEHGIIDFSNIPDVSENAKTSEAALVYTAEQELKKFLMALSFETITDVITLMYMGRDGDANMQLQADERFYDYWEYLCGTGCFSDNAYNLVTHMTEKDSLADYLDKGLRVIGWK